MTAMLLCLPRIGRAQAPQYTISTVVGTGMAGYGGDTGPATSAEINNPCQMTVDAAGTLYFADENNYLIREVSAKGIINYVVGDGGEGYSGDGGPATQAEIAQPCGVAVDSSGNIYFSQEGQAGLPPVIREAVKGGDINTIVGSTSEIIGYAGDGGPATSAELNSPVGIAFDAAGNLYIADSGNQVIRQISTNGTINTVVGNNTPSFAGDGGPATSASLWSPQAIAFDSAGNMYIADEQNNRIRKVSNGVITTIAGNGATCPIGSPCFSGDGGPATLAQLNLPNDVAVDASGNIYVLDDFNFRVRMITAAGTIYTIAGNGDYGYGGDGGPATSAKFGYTHGLTLGPNGVIYISDSGNARIRMLTPVPEAPSIRSSEGILEGAGFTANVSAGGIASIFGSFLATSTASATSLPLQTKLNGTSVTMNGIPCPLIYVSSGQINLQVPWELQSASSATVIVTTINGSSPSMTIPLSPAAPGIFIISGTQGAVEIAGTATFAGPVDLIPGLASEPAAAGQYISVFCSGLGAVANAPADGAAGAAQATNSSVTATIEGVNATVSFAGLAPGFVGLYQVNVLVPSGLTANNAAPLILSTQGLNSNTATIAVQ